MNCGGLFVGLVLKSQKTNEMTLWSLFIQAGCFTVSQFSISRTAELPFLLISQR